MSTVCQNMLAGVLMREMGGVSDNDVYNLDNGRGTTWEENKINLYHH